jgi:hypothetical protein
VTLEPDQFAVASLVNGLPTCTFLPRPYHRTITNIVVTNGATSVVNCYRGALTAPPVATNSLGARNTLSGQITIPSGQLFFVQWTVAGNPVSSGTARVSWQKTPFDDSGHDSQSWAESQIASLTLVGTNGSQIVLNADALYPSITFYSPDHSNSGSIVETGGTSNADILLTSGTFVPADTVPRRGRLWFDGAVDQVLLDVMKAADQTSLGGVLILQSNRAYYGYRDVDGGVFYWLHVTNAGAWDIVGTSLDLNATTVNIGTAFVENEITNGGVSQGRGYRDDVASTASSVAIGVEAVVHTSNTFTWKNGRAYKVSWHQEPNPTASPTFVVMRIRRTNLAGALLVEDVTALPVAVQTTSQNWSVVVNRSGADVTDNIVLTAGTGAGTVTMFGAAPRSVRSLHIEECGAETQFSFNASIA